MDNNDENIKNSDEAKEVSADEAISEQTEDGNPEDTDVKTDKIEVIEINGPETGQKIKTITLKNGVPHGELLIYGEDGSVSHKLNFVDGVLSGPAEFFQNNQILMKTNFKNGLQDGETVMFLNEKKSSVMHCKNGYLDGLFSSYDDQGNLVREANYTAGKMNGECSVYYPDGALMEHSVYKDNKLDGEVLRFYQNGVVRETANYDNGVPVGYIDTYDTDGNLLESKEV